MRLYEIMELNMNDDKTNLLKEDQNKDPFIEDVVGPIYGVSPEEVVAWVKSWATGNRLPRPKPKRVR